VGRVLRRVLIGLVVLVVVLFVVWASVLFFFGE
jgi:hypothetical protein